MMNWAKIPAWLLALWCCAGYESHAGAECWMTAFVSLGPHFQSNGNVVAVEPVL